MADNTTTTEKKSFLSGVMDGFSTVASNAGALADAYAKIKGTNTSATPGANGAGAPAAQPNASTGMSSTVKTVLLGIGVAILALVGIKLWKR